MRCTEHPNVARDMIGKCKRGCITALGTIIAQLSWRISISGLALMIVRIISESKWGNLLIIIFRFIFCLISLNFLTALTKRETSQEASSWWIDLVSPLKAKWYIGPFSSNFITRSSSTIKHVDHLSKRANVCISFSGPRSTVGAILRRTISFYD